MNNWIKFSDKIPEEYQAIWISDGVEVMASKYYPLDKHDESLYYWMARINPAPPGKEKHRCEFEKYKNYYCYERDDRLYIHYENSYPGLPSVVELEAKYCPFCGFTLENK